MRYPILATFLCLVGIGCEPPAGKTPSGASTNARQAGYSSPENDEFAELHARAIAAGVDKLLVLKRSIDQPLVLANTASRSVALPKEYARFELGLKAIPEIDLMLKREGLEHGIDEYALVIFTPDVRETRLFQTSDVAVRAPGKSMRLRIEDELERLKRNLRRLESKD